MGKSFLPSGNFVLLYFPLVTIWELSTSLGAHNIWQCSSELLAICTSLWVWLTLIRILAVLFWEWTGGTARHHRYYKGIYSCFFLIWELEIVTSQGTTMEDSPPSTFGKKLTGPYYPKLRKVWSSFQYLVLGQCQNLCVYLLTPVCKPQGWVTIGSHLRLPCHIESQLSPSPDNLQICTRQECIFKRLSHSYITSGFFQPSIDRWSLKCPPFPSQPSLAPSQVRIQGTPWWSWCNPSSVLISDSNCAYWNWTSLFQTPSLGVLLLGRWPTAVFILGQTWCQSTLPSLCSVKL